MSNTPSQNPQRIVGCRCRFFLGLFTAAIVVYSAPASFGQSGSGIVSGAVINVMTGKYLEGAEVSVEGTDVHGTTSREGSFILRGVRAGFYKVTVAYPSLATKSIPVTVKEGETSELVFRLASDVVALGEFRVQGTREGMAEAVALQKISVQAKIVAASDQYGPISEGNVGEYLKFLPGVSIDYNVNDARGVSLRGLSTAFTIVAVDGTPMAGGSSTDDTRRFEFEQIAMNNVETTELYKTVTPDIPASATGGYVNFVTKSAFDSEDVSRFTYDLSFSAPNSRVSLERQGGVWGHSKQFVVRPSVEMNYARRLSPKLGINFNYRLSEKFDDSPRTEITWVTTATAPTVMTVPRLQQYNIRLEEKLTHREAFATKLDYHFSDAAKLMVSGQWNWYDLPFTQRGPSFVLGTASTASGDTYTSGSGKAINNGTLQREKYGTTLHFNGRFDYQLGDSKASVTAYWSHADSQYRDASKGFISAVAALPTTAYTAFTLSNVQTQRLPTIAIVNGATSVPLDFLRSLANYTYSNTVTGTNLQSRPWTALDTKKGVYADYSYDLKHHGLPLTLETGVALDQIDRYIHRPDFRGAVATVPGSSLVALADQGFTQDVAYGFGQYQVLDPYSVWSIFAPNLTSLNTDAIRNFAEKNTAAYLRADAQIVPDLLLIGGVRWEKRKIDATGQTGVTSRNRLAEVSLDYGEWYPSLSFKYTPKAIKALVVRGGVSRTVGHPDYINLLPTITSESTSGARDGTISVPNPALKPYFAKNYDLSVDYFLKNAGVLSASVFLKDVDNFIISRGMTADELTSISQFYGYNPAEFSSGTVQTNGGDSRLQGFELSYAQQFTFLPKPFNGLNLQANYTYVDISASDIDTLYSQMRAVSPKTWNLVLGYRYKDLTVTTMTNWVDDSLYGGFVNTNYFVGTANTANPALDTRLALFKASKLTTDMKIEYSFSKKFSVYFLVRNVFNSPRKEYYRGYLPQYQSVVLPYRYFEFGEPHLTLGVRGRF